MVQCPFCHYNNEDGALFCEQCKSDLAGVAATVEARRRRIGRGHADGGDADGGDADGSDADGGDADGGRCPCSPSRSRWKRLPLETARPSRRRRPSPPRRRRLRRRRPRRLLRRRRRPGGSRAAPAPAPAAAPAAPAGAGIPPGAQPKLVVLRGQKPKAEYPLFEGPNFVGRADEKPVDVDLEDQEPPDRVWSSRQHACIHFEDGQLSIEDLNSSNGTFVNRARIYPGTKKPLSVNDVIQIGNVQLKVVV